MNELSVKNYLSEQLNFSPNDIQKLEIFKNELLSFNLKYNLISKKSEKDVWHRHILDSAQLINFIDFKLILDCYVLQMGEEDTQKLLEHAVKSVKMGNHSQLFENLPKNLIN